MNYKISTQIATFFAGEQTVLPGELTILPGELSSLGPPRAEYYIREETRYCGPCYGASPLPDLYEAPDWKSEGRELIEGCCVSCEEVKGAYEALPWTVGSAYDHVEQCMRERKPWELNIGFD